MLVDPISGTTRLRPSSKRPPCGLASSYLALYLLLSLVAQDMSKRGLRKRELGVRYPEVLSMTSRLED